MLQGSADVGWAPREHQSLTIGSRLSKTRLNATLPINQKRNVLTAPTCTTHVYQPVTLPHPTYPASVGLFYMKFYCTYV